MPSSNFAKYAPGIFQNIQSAPVALIDKNFKFEWYSNKFKERLGTKRIKGVSVFKLLNIDDEIEASIRKAEKTFVFPSASLSCNIVISPLFDEGKRKLPDAYLIELVNIEKPTLPADTNKELFEKNLQFQNELQAILVLLLQENSLAVLKQEILNKCVTISSADFGVVISDIDMNKLGFLYHDTNKLLNNKNEIENTIRSDFSYISKWLELNNHSLIAMNQSTNIGFNLTKVLNSKCVVVSPCFFDNKLLASVIVGKQTGDFSQIEISQVEQLASILSFAISSIKTRELNTALEGRLLQAQKLETIGKLSSGMAHDFSNLLSSIFGSLNLLRKRVPKSENVYKLIDNIENCSVRARDLTKGLLSYGKPTPKRKELVKPNSLTTEISKVITQTFPRTITFNNKISENLYDILGNGTEIYQILLNLCVNAKEATDGHGSIWLSAKNITIDENNLKDYPLLDIGNYVCFSVKDDGVGIEENDLKQIFDPYFSTKSKDTGSGLGLYVTYGIIKAHNGFIDVTSQPGKGTTFDVYIPAFEPAKIKKPEPSEKIILLADDEPMLSDLLAELLESNGYNVIKVSSGKEALKVLTEEIKVDLAIIDYNMPGINGLDTITEIRKLNLDIPVILSSGSMKVDDELDLSKYNINSRIQKPYEFDAMLATIQKWI